MSVKDLKTARRLRIKKGIRKKVYGHESRPRLSVFRSNTSIYVQIINDDAGKTVVSYSSSKKEVKDQKMTKTEASQAVGRKIAELAKAAGISQVVFDRNGYKYHGRVKALAEAAREGGLNF